MRSHAARRSFFIQRGSLEEGSWDAFLPYRSKSRFSGTSNNPLQAAYSFEQNGCSQKGVLRGIRLGRIFALSVKKQLFPNPHIIPFKPVTVLNKTVSSKRGSLGGSPWDAFSPYRSKSNFSQTLISSLSSRLQF